MHWSSWTPAAEEEGAGGAMFPTGQPGRRAGGAWRRHAEGDDDQRRHPDHLRRRRVAWLHRRTELQDAINGDAKALAMFETIRAHGALRMGLIGKLDEIAQRASTRRRSRSSRRRAAPTPRRAARRHRRRRRRPAGARLVDGQAASRDDGHGRRRDRHGGGDSRHPRESRGGRRRERLSVRFGHPSGTLRVGAEAVRQGEGWTVTKAIMSRSARVLMEGWVRVPG
jgi:hypothetical protein